MDNLPTRTGYYWAKWRIPAPGTHDAFELCPSDTWEIVQVNDNNGTGDEQFSVLVPGVRETQWPDCFVWGSRISDLEFTEPAPLTTIANLRHLKTLVREPWDDVIDKAIHLISRLKS